MWVALIVIIGVATAAVMGIAFVGLARRAKLLAETLKRFQAEVEPTLEQIRAGAERAQGRVEDLSSRRPGKPPGARIRR